MEDAVFMDRELHGDGCGSSSGGMEPVTFGRTVVGASLLPSKTVTLWFGRSLWNNGR